MTSGQYINLIFIILGLSGCFYALYSVLIRIIRQEMNSMEEDIVKRLSKTMQGTNAHN